MAQNPSRSAKYYNFLDQFSCLGAECEDTCCVGWSMQLDAERKTLYEEKAPELLNAITPSGDSDYVMKRDPNTDYCIKFDQGLCGIHKNYGENFLGDACYFFPRVTRNFGDATLVSATLSCPEIARLALLASDPFKLIDKPIERLPFSVKDYLPEALSSDDALSIIQTFLDAAGDKTITIEHALGRIISASKSLDNIDVVRWKDAASFLIRTADSRLTEPLKEPADPYRLLHALAGLIAATGHPKRERLMQTFTHMEQALNAYIDWETLTINARDLSLTPAHDMQVLWNHTKSQDMEHILRKWLQMQLVMMGFPFAGLGANVTERITIISVRFATVKLALMSYLQVKKSLPDTSQIIRIIQGLSRFLDHLADPNLSLLIYKDADWLREARLIALIGYNAPAL